MRILPILSQNFYFRTCQQPAATRPSGFYPVLKPLQADTVSFGRTAENAELMRKLFKYGMIDIHTGQRLIDPDYFKEILQRHIFSGNLKSVINVLKPLEDCLHDVEKQVFSYLEEYSKKNPSATIDKAIKLLAPIAQKDLYNKQKPIFDELKEASVSMPAEQKEAFDELMNITESKLQKKKIPYRFSKKEFRYKLSNITKEIERRGIDDEIKVMKKLNEMAKELPYSPSGRNYLRRKVKFEPDKSIKQANIIRKMESVLQRSSLKGDNSLNILIANAKQQVFNIPMIVPFERRTFIHELASILDTIPDEKLARKMTQIACKLPSAKEEMSAFILKSVRNSSEKIGHDLLVGSVGNIDHIIEHKNGGKDVIENYAFSSQAYNSKRGSTSMRLWMRKNPKTYEGAQKCVDRLIELYKEGILDKEGLSPWYIVNFANKMKRVSPQEKPLIIDYSALDLTKL